MITVTNAADTAKVLITGDIGESFWGDGYTLEKLKSEIPDDVSNAIVELKTLGGNSAEALSMYDFLRNIPAKVTTRIIGRTASAGATIFMAGDEREITENSDFLIHRGSTITIGNVDDHEQSIEILEQHDTRIANIYQKGTGKRKSQIESLMKQEKFISADEAVSWGFAHKVIKSKKTILNKAEMDTTKIKEILKVETDELIESAVTNLIDKAAKVDELQAIVDQHTAAEAAAHEAEITNYVTDAVTAGKVTDAVKDSLINLAKTDFDAVKNIIEAAKPAPLKNHVEEGAGDNEPEKLDKKKFVENFKKGVYAKDINKYKADFKEVYGKEPVI